jgi:hypothetical protein
MLTSTSLGVRADLGAAKLIVSVIRMAATIGFVIAPGSLGFGIIGVTEHLIRRLMVQR